MYQGREIILGLSVTGENHIFPGMSKSDLLPLGEVLMWGVSFFLRGNYRYHTYSTLAIS